MVQEQRESSTAKAIRILALSDKVQEIVYSEAVRERFGRIDVVLAAGDLPFPYLEYVLTLLGVPLFYVPGNHDRPTHTADGRTVRFPEGAVALDGRVQTIELPNHRKLTVAGLGGSMRYSNGSNQYTNWEMGWRVARLETRILFRRLRDRRAVDILLTHAPPAGLHDAEDLCHQGFSTFLGFLKRVKPRLHIHGHIHPSYGVDTRPVRYYETEVRNVYGAELIEIEAR